MDFECSGGVATSYTTSDFDPSDPLLMVSLKEHNEGTQISLFLPFVSRLGPLLSTRENGVDEIKKKTMFQVKYNKRKERERRGRGKVGCPFSRSGGGRDELNEEKHKTFFG